MEDNRIKPISPSPTKLKYDTAYKKKNGKKKKQGKKEPDNSTVKSGNLFDDFA